MNLLSGTKTSEYVDSNGEADLKTSLFKEEGCRFLTYDFLDEKYQCSKENSSSFFLAPEQRLMLKPSEHVIPQSCEAFLIGLKVMWMAGKKEGPFQTRVPEFRLRSACSCADTEKKFPFLKSIDSFRNIV